MKKYGKQLAITLMAFAFIFGISGQVMAATSPTLGTAGSYSVLAGSIVTNTGFTTMPGNLGISPSIGVPPHVTGIPPGIVNAPGVIHDADANAALAQADSTSAYGALSAAPNAACTVDYGAVTKDLAGLSLTPGIYCANAFLLTGTLTLNDTGAANGVWIFRSELSTLVTAPGVDARVQFLTGVASACNVWWKVASSATIGAGTTFIGNILALTSITMETGANLDGRALAQTGAVTLDTNTFTNSVCASTIPSGGDTNGSTSNTSGSSTTVVPKFPNTGINSEDNSNRLWYIVIPTGLLITSGLLYFARKKQLI